MFLATPLLLKKTVLFFVTNLLGVSLLVNSRRGVCVLSLYVKRSFSIFIMKKTAVPLLKFTNKEVNYSEHSQRKLFFFSYHMDGSKKNQQKYCHEYSLYRNLKFCAYFIGLRLYGAPDPCNSNLHRRFWSKFPEYGCFTGTHIDFLFLITSSLKKKKRGSGGGATGNFFLIVLGSAIDFFS